jgi:exodeoxyribonuclease VII large subunit
MSMDFFEFREQIARKPEPKPAGKDDALSVSQLTSIIERAIKSGVPASVSVKGEVSNFSNHRSSGHFYFTLKDANACIDCVMFKGDAQRLKFAPTDGSELIAGGRVGVYPVRGRYQLYVTSLSPLGQGALELAFQQLCAKLEKEGLFEAERKKPIPEYPLHIALVTSRQTAALQDILKVLRRFAFLRLSVFHVPVQGDGSAEEISNAIQLLNRPVTSRSAFDVILLARGGGSLEDLWEFNEEVVARAIASSRIPIVTGIGHEVDVSIADLVADYHAHTPTEAAQVIVANWRTAPDALETVGIRQRRAMQQILQEARQRLTAIERHEMFRRPLDRVNLLRQLLDDRQRSLTLAVAHRLRFQTARLERISSSLIECHPRHRVELLSQRISEFEIRFRSAMRRNQEMRMNAVNAKEAQLRALSPEAVLKRGYSITTIKKGGAIVRTSNQVKPGDRMLTRFADGTVESTVEDQKQLPLFD